MIIIKVLEVCSVVLYTLLFKYSDYDVPTWSSFERSVPGDSGDKNAQSVALCTARTDSSTVGSALQSTVTCADDNLQAEREALVFSVLLLLGCRALVSSFLMCRRWLFLS